MSEEIKKLSVKEFRAMGGVQEINKCFLHPRGMALEVIIDGEGNEKFGEIWDYRDDPEGMLFAKGSLNQDNIESFEKLYTEKKEYRESILNGKSIQEK